MINNHALDYSAITDDISEFVRDALQEIGCDSLILELQSDLKDPILSE